MNVHVPQSGKRLLLSPISIAILALATGANVAYAQANTTGAAAAEQAAPADAGKITEVFVTATKRTTSLQKTPVAVTALNSAALDDNHVQTIQDVVNLVPGFSATGQGDHGVITMTLRGIGNDSAKTEYADPEVATFVDGIYSPRPEGATALLFDLEAIEVLRGPQGTLWGRNSTVGAVNMQTVKPEIGSNAGNFELGYGNYTRIGARGAFNIPLSNTMAMRVSVVHEQHDGYVDYQAPVIPSLASQQAAAAPVIAAWNKAHPLNPIAFRPINENNYIRNGQKYNAQDQSAVRLGFLWQPSADLKWNISYEHYVDRGTPNINMLQQQRAGQEFWSALVDTAPNVNRDSNSVRSRVDYQINNDVALAYIAGYSRFNGSSTFDQDGGANPATSFTTAASSTGSAGYQANNTVWSKYKNYSHELEIMSTGKRDVDWLLGLYYANEDNGIRFDIPIMNGTENGTVSWQGSFIQPKETVDSKAAFGQATWNVNDQWHLTGGFRYTSDKRENIGGTGNGWSNTDTVPQVPVSPSMNPLAPGGNNGFSTYSFNSGSYSGNKLTGLARVTYDIDKNNIVFASVSTGYKSGGLQDGGRPYGAETLTNYEIGSKSTFFGGKLRMNNAAYYSKFKDFQFSAPVTNADGSRGLATSNADGAKVWGLETEIAAKITPDDRVQLTAAYTNAKLKHLIGGSNDYNLPACTVPGITNPCLDVSGNTMPHSPSFSAQLQYQHSFALADGTLIPRISTHYETASWLSVFNLGEPDRQKAYNRTDLGLRYDANSKWYFDAFVRNVEDGKIKTSAMNANGPWQAQYLPPRTFGINVGRSF
ncbi:iron complex outermembrane recepter protein [Duganella sp. CF402]|uniref:TonB-dependent receptor n=1 Tax=unclassified Duganella TaxID=2636909 RepID=UPI0008BC8881|nr:MULTISPECIES: TonB-dependent receptor [unclassified Duganella]RZT08124.1 iron complex outermembrane receptor protein [Duganella sp. BK701]SEM04748.1 iron complex outermembrane recepter protein [Duganella sp. CF402]